MSIVIVGAGPNLGAAVARRFGREGMAVGLVSRDAGKLELLTQQLAGEGLRVGVPGRPIFATAIGCRPRSANSPGEVGGVEVLEYSPLPAGEFMKPILETTVEDLRAPLEFSVLGAVAAARVVIGPMLEPRFGDDPIHDRRSRDQPVPTPCRRGRRVRWGGCLRADAARRGQRPGSSCRSHCDRRAHRPGRRPRARRHRRSTLAATHRAHQVSDQDRYRLIPPAMQDALAMQAALDLLE